LKKIAATADAAVATIRPQVAKGSKKVTIFFALNTPRLCHGFNEIHHQQHR